jgi:hypothetical protein
MQRLFTFISLFLVLILFRQGFALQAFIGSLCFLHMLGHFLKLSLSLLDHLIQHVDIWTYNPLFYLLVDFLWRRIGCYGAILKRHLRVNSSNSLRFRWHAFFRSSYLTPQWSRQNVGVKFFAATRIMIWLDEDFDPSSNWRVKPTTRFTTIAIKASGAL